MGIIRFLKDWTLPVAIATGTVCYLTFYYVPQFLLVTFCKVNFHEMRPHRWHTGILMAQLLLVAVIVGICLSLRDCPDTKLVWEAILTCVIGPSAAAAPVVVGKLGGNISTMTTYTLLSSFFSALMIPLVFPILEQTVHVAFFDAFLIILEKVSMVLLLPLVLGWLMQHYVKGICARIAAMPNLSFYCWAFSLSITSGITVKNIVHRPVDVHPLLGAVLYRTRYRQAAG